jgi:putative flippase GtrA
LVNLREIIVFFFVGILNTSVDIGVFSILKYVLQIPNDSPYILIINFVSVSISIIVSFIANKYGTFQSKDAIAKKEIGLFLVVNAVSFAINSLILIIVIGIIPSNFIIDSAILGKLFGTGGSMIISFIGYKVLVFKK